MQIEVNKNERAPKRQLVLGYLWGAGALWGSLCWVGCLFPREYGLLGMEGRECCWDQYQELLSLVLLQPLDLTGTVGRLLLGCTPRCYWPSPTERFSCASGMDPG